MSKSANAVANVIKFPVENKNLPSLQNIEDMKTAAIQNKVDFVAFIADEITHEAFAKLAAFGFYFDDDRYQKDTVMVLESIRSIMLKTFDVEHDMQQIAEDLICFDDETEELTD